MQLTPSSHANIESETTIFPDTHLLKVFAVSALGLCLLAGADSAVAAGANNDNTKRTTATPQSDVRKKTVNKVTYQRSSSEETPAQRERRMLRECKGMHNAGACRGYTR